MNQQGTDTKDTKERIIAKVSELLRVQGVRNVRMDDLAEQLGISKKTIYNLFKDKDEIVFLAVIRSLEEDKNNFEKINREAVNIIDEIVKLSLHIREMTRTMHPTLLMDLKKLYPTAFQAFLLHKECCLRDNLNKSLEKGKKEGLIRKEIHTQIITKMRMEQVQMAFDSNIFPYPEYNLTEVQMAMFDHFIHGICTAKGLELLAEYQKQIS